MADSDKPMVVVPPPFPIRVEVYLLKRPEILGRSIRWWVTGGSTALLAVAAHLWGDRLTTRIVATIPAVLYGIALAYSDLWPVNRKIQAVAHRLLKKARAGGDRLLLSLIEIESPEGVRAHLEHRYPQWLVDGLVDELLRASVTPPSEG